MKNKKLILSVVLILLVATACVCMFAGCEAVDKAKDKIGEVVEKFAIMDGNGQTIVENETNPMPERMIVSGLKMAGTNADRNTTLVATVEPSTAIDKKVDWAVAWVNPTSTFANGKTVTDYITVTPTVDGSNTAKTAFKKAFGERIKITVTCRANSSATAECIVDYLASSGTLVQLNGGEYGSVMFGESANNAVNYISSSLLNLGGAEFLHTLETGSNAVYSVVQTSNTYTLSDSIVGTPEVYIKFSSAAVTSLVQSLSAAYSESDVKGFFPTSFVTLKNTEVSNRPDALKYYDFAYTACLFRGNIMGMGPTLGNMVKSGFASTSGTHFTIKITSKYKYAGTVSKEYTYRFSDDSLGLTAASVSLSTTQIIM